MHEHVDATTNPDGPATELERLRAENAALRALVEQLQQRIAELEARLNKDSHNSNKPPSSDSPFKKPPPRSQRKSAGRKPGGQKGHPGATRELAEDPDQRVTVPLSGECDCGRACAAIAAEVLPERRQVIELEIRRQVVEYRTVAGTCACGRVHRSDFPEGVAAPVQYGPSVSALAVYLTEYQLLLYQRTAELLAQVGGIPLSPGSVHRAVAVAGHRLKPMEQAIRDALITVSVAHADETGIRVGTKLYWLHVLSTPALTAYFPHPKRGAEALDAFGLLELFTGVLVPDHWSAYERYRCLHAFCNAHHLRELIALAETIPSQQRWAEDMSALLCEANTRTAAARLEGLDALPAAEVERLHERYDAILDTAAQRNPPRSPPPGSKRRVKQSPAYNLVKRLREKREEVLRFITDLRVPFDNDQAERDMRMAKLKQKISGTFRTDAGLERFATIRSYLSTLHKQGADVFQALVLTFQGSPPVPALGVAE
ncbi:MAG: IS66 family transposase [Chromatiaceae bacterium]|nr:MAG: IS66 family transposase [Chromatiaceae bacterium]